MAELPSPTSSHINPHQGRFQEHLPGPFVSQGITKIVKESDDISTFTKLEHFYEVQDGFDFSLVHLDAHTVSIRQLYDGTLDVTKHVVEVFNDVVDAFDAAPVNTIEWQIRKRFVYLFMQLKADQAIPFTLDEARKLNQAMGLEKISPIVPTFSMLQLHPQTLLDEEGINKATLELLIDLYDGNIDRSMPGAEQAIQAFNKVVKTPVSGCHLDQMKSRLNALPTKTSWRKVVMIAAAGIVTLYLANRLIMRPVLQWYRTRGTRV